MPSRRSSRRGTASLTDVAGRLSIKSLLRVERVAAVRASVCETGIDDHGPRERMTWREWNWCMDLLR